MLKFDNDNIITGYIKQLLSSFNLPKYRVYTKENEVYFKRYGKEKDIISTVLTGDHIRHAHYIKDGLIQEYVPSDASSTGYEWKPIVHPAYHYNKKILNKTKTLQIKNNFYDSYTHEYLGDYLRFQRDYNQIDLMSMYNCFSNTLCTNLNLECTHVTRDDSGKAVSVTHFVFDSDDPNYKIYIMPVKLFKKYTIAIDSSKPVELCCVIYNKSLDTREKLQVLTHDTYVKKTNTNFNRPFLYSELAEIQPLLEPTDPMELAQNESNLKLLIKLPADNKSTIVVLEGDYTNCLPPTTVGSGTEKTIIKNKTVTNYNIEDRVDGDFTDESFYMFRPITQPQLLQLNTGEQYPFADRLIEYLVGNVVTNDDDLEDNVKRLQTVMMENNIDLEFGVSGL